MTHAIITCSDSRFGDFLIQHWGRSLLENVDLRDLDVIVFDYGLTGEQRKAIEAMGFHTCPGRRDGHVVNVRFRDIGDWLIETSYDQVLVIDGGDIIFQSDIRHLFDENIERLRAVCEEVPVHSSVECMDTSDFEPGVYRELYDSIKNRPLINGGFLLGSRELILKLYRECCDQIISMRCAGTDQLLLNYQLYRGNFVALENRYNFVLLTAACRFQILNGQFFDDCGELIPVVHNAGMSMRLIKKFGYGPGRNRKNHAVAMGRAVWFTLPAGVRRNLADWRRRRRARKAQARSSFAQVERQAAPT